MFSHDFSPIPKEPYIWITYLIQDNVRDAIVDKLHFKDNKHLLWGTNEEICYNLPLVFQCLLFDLISKDSIYRELTEKILCSYIPFARYLAYHHVIFEMPSPIEGYSTSDFYPTNIWELYETVDAFADKAIAYLYQKCHSDFYNTFLQFCTSHDSYKKWTKYLDIWVKEQIIPIISKYKPTSNSVGSRIYSLILTDYSYIPSLVLSDTFKEPNILAIQKMISATDQYIEQLENINNEYCCMELLNHIWIFHQYDRKAITLIVIAFFYKESLYFLCFNPQLYNK